MPRRTAARRFRPAHALRVVRAVVGTTIALALASTIGITPTSGAIAAPATGIVAGTVTGSDGAPAVGISVSLRNAVGGSWDTRTDASGSYRFDSAAPGRYTLSFSCWTSCVGNYVSEYWDDTRSFDDRTWFDLAGGQQVDLATELELAGEISGVVRGDDGKPVAGVTVYLESVTPGVVPPHDFAETDAEGRYRFRNLPEGGYKLQFAPETHFAHEYFGEFWQDRLDAASADVVRVGPGEKVDGIDPRLTPAAWISGRVVNEDGVPLGWDADVNVFLYRVTDAGTSWVRTSGLLGYPLGPGEFRFDGLEAGTYVLYTRALSHGLAEWWDDQPDLAAADRIVLDVGERFEGTIVLEGGPVSLTGPTLSGTARVGEPLTATASSPTPGAILSYQWQVGGEPIDGATEATFVPTAAQLEQQLTVRVTAAAPGRATMSRDSWYSDHVAPGVLTAATPAIVGDAVMGNTLRVDPGVWTAGTQFTYRWYRSGTVVSTAPELALTSEHVGGQLRVDVTGTLPGYTSAARSSGTSMVWYGTVELTRPVITGTPEAGSTLTAVAASPTPGAALTYAWYADDEVVSQTTVPSLTLGAHHVGARIHVVVTASANLYRPITLASTPTRGVLGGGWRDAPGLFGPDLSTRSVAISAARFHPGVTSVHLASASRYPDAAAALRLPAGDEPLLLTPSTRLPRAVLEEIVRLKPRYIVILGGTESVSAGIEQQLAGLASHGVQRIVDWDAASVASASLQGAAPSGAETAPAAGGTTDAWAGGARESADLAGQASIITTRVGALG